MACFSPLVRYYPIGQPMKAKVVSLKNWNNTPLAQKNYTWQEIPCGHCLACRLEYSKQWATRCVLEAKKYKDNCMLTVTYNEENIPKVKGVDVKTGELTEVTTLQPRDITLFLKLLRKKYKFRYYMCGEYGSETTRAHYHILMFGFKPTDLKLYKMNLKGYPVWKSEELTKIWKKGYVTVSEFNYESAAYVARYIMKKQKGPHAKEEYEIRNQVPEYTTMSRRPGIAHEYFNEKGEVIYETQKIWTQTQKGLLKVKPPRYFDKLYDELFPDKFEKIKEARKELAKMRQDMMLKSTDLNREEYMKQQEKVMEKKLKTKSRPFEQEQ